MIRPTTLALLLTLGAGGAAARGTPCDDCAACTTALAAPGADVQQSGPLKNSGAGACITITGAGATFDGAHHPISAGEGIGVKVAADDVLLRNVRVEGGATGIEAQAHDLTIYASDVRGAAVGLGAAKAPGLRVDRSRFEAGLVGVAFGTPKGGACPAGALQSPGVVVLKSEITGAEVGIAACSARPVLVDNTVRANGLGVLLGDPAPPANVRGPAARAPFDPCACAPELEGVKPGTTMLYSSGCGGCLVHEGWLPDVRAQGHDVKLRKSGLENKAAQAEFDGWVRRCAPAIVDAIGTPGCVPNYACPATGALFKRKGEDGRLVFESQLNSADAVAGFAAECASAAAAHYGGDACLQHPLRGNRLCGNTTADVAGTAGDLAGADNACGKVQGDADPQKLGCHASCVDAAPAGAAAPTTARPAPAPTAAPKPAPAAPKPAPAARSPRPRRAEARARRARRARRPGRRSERPGRRGRLAFDPRPRPRPAPVDDPRHPRRRRGRRLDVAERQGLIDDTDGATTRLPYRPYALSTPKQGALALARPLLLPSPAIDTGRTR
ncbi:MAG: hypothetical protein H6704_03075 [Myxococcales bacterium]|nr:hypothetical protein [Myxococcales bacterium]